MGEQGPNVMHPKRHGHARLLWASLTLLSFMGLAARLQAQTTDSFDPGTDPDVYGVGIQGDGKVVVWGHFTMLGGQSRSRIGRVNPDGKLDEEFKAVASDDVLTVSIQGDGKLLVGGVFTALCGQARNYFGRLNSDGTLDESFNPAPNNYVYSVAVQADGRILVGGAFTMIGGEPRNHLARLNADGSLDPTFDPSVDGYVYASLIEQADGKILLGGEFITVGGEYHTNIARLYPNGSVDSAFVAEIGNPAYRMAVQADGRILLGGAFTSVNGQPRRFIARLNAGGTLDTGFDPGADMWVHSFVPQTDGRVLVGGEFFVLGGCTRTNLARLNADGSVDSAFSANTGGIYYPDVRCLAVQADGRVIAGGWFGTLGGQYRSNLGRLINSDPATESLSFSGSTIIWQRAGTSPELLRATFCASTNGADWFAMGEGQRVTGGWQLANVALPANAALRARGYVAGGDGGSSGWFRESFGGPPALVVQPLSRTNNAGTTTRFSVYAGGTAPLFYQWRKDSVNLADGANLSGTLGASLVFSSVFGADAGNYSLVVTNAQGSVTSLVATLTVNDPVVTSQPASRTNNAGTIALFAVTAAGSAPLIYEWRKNGTPLAEGGNVLGVATPSLSVSNVMGSDAGEYSVLVTSPYGVVTSLVAVLRVTDPVINSQPVSRAVYAGRSVTFNVSATGTAPAYQWRKDGEKLDGATAVSLTLSNVQRSDIGGYDVVVSNVFGSVTSAVANLSVNLAMPEPFNPAVNGAVYALALQPDSKVLIGGAFTTVGGEAHWGIARLLAGGMVDTFFSPQITRFPPGGTPYVGALAVQPDGRIVAAGSFYMLAGQIRGSLGRLNADGTLDAAFNPSPNGPVLALALQPDGKILVGGSFTTLAAQSRVRLGRLNVDGSLDTNFNVVVNNTVNTIAVQPDGKILLGGVFTAVTNQPRSCIARLNPNGTIDTGFNPGAATNVSCLLVQPDGKIVVGGSFTTLAGLTRTNLGRLNTNGTLDTAFSPGVNGPITSLALQADGKIIVAGQFSTLAGKGRNDLGRLNSDGTIDGTFFPGDSDNISVSAVAVDSEGRVLVGGQSFLLLGGQTRSNFCRLSATDPATQTLAADGSTVAWLRGGTSPELSRANFETSINGTDWISLGDGARISNGWQVAGVSLPPDARIRARGLATGGRQNGSVWTVESSVGPLMLVTQPQSRTNIAATTAAFSVAAAGSSPINYWWLKNGAPLTDAGFVSGSTTPSLVLSNVLGADAGTYSVVLSNSFGGATSMVATLTVIDPFLSSQPTNQLINAGQPVTFTVTVAGTSPAFQWRKDGITLNGATAQALTLNHVSWADRGGYDVVVSNAFGSVTSSIAVLNVNLAVPDSFNPGANSYAFGLAVQPDGKILVGGGFTTLGGQSRMRLGRLHPDGALDTGFDAGMDSGSWLVHCLAVQPGGQILVGGEFSTLGGQTRLNLARLNPDGTLEATFNPGAGGYYVNSMVVQPDGRIVVGGEFTSLGGQSRNNLGRVAGDGVLDPTFDPGANTIVCALAVADDGATLVGGYFTALGGQPRSRLGRLNASGILDASFDPSASSTVYCLAVQPDGKILVGGSFTTLAGQSRSCLGRLYPDGSLDSGFNPDVNGTVQSFALQADGRILIGGEFTLVGGQSRNRLARLNRDGTLEPTFNPGANGGVTALALQLDGKLLVAGGFSLLAGQSRACLGRLSNTEAATQSLTYDGSTLTWLRGGTSPETWRCTFESSADGTNWVLLGFGTRKPGGWGLSGVTVPANSFLRARGFVSAGQFNGSGWYVENTMQASAYTPPVILADDSSLGFRTNQFRFVVRALPRQAIIIQASTNYINWVPLQTNLVTDTGLVLFTDPQSPAFPHRFYRARVHAGPLPAPAFYAGGGGPGFQAGNFTFQFSGVPGQPIVIDASTNLALWLPLVTNVAGLDTLRFLDPDSTNCPARFYRLRLQ